MRILQFDSNCSYSIHNSTLAWYWSPIQVQAVAKVAERQSSYYGNCHFGIAIVQYGRLLCAPLSRYIIAVLEREKSLKPLCRCYKWSVITKKYISLRERKAPPVVINWDAFPLLCLLYSTELPVCLYNCRQSGQGEASQLKAKGGAFSSVRIYILWALLLDIQYVAP